MTGEAFYNAYKATALDFGFSPEDCPPWETLGAQEQVNWEQLAMEQELRDRELPDRLKEIDNAHG